jgi:hypothetical protein
MLVCLLFINFVKSFDFGCCSLAQEMSFVDCYLPYFRQRLITHPLWALLNFLALFTECWCGDQLFALPPFSSALRAPHPLCCVFLFSFLFIIIQFCFVFLWSMGQSVQGAILAYPRGSCGNTACRLFAHLLVCVCQAGLEQASGGVGALLFSQCNVAWRSFV